MKSEVRIVKDRGGWWIFIEDEHSEQSMAVTNQELDELYKILKKRNET